MVLVCPFRIPFPDPKPFHLAVTETFTSDYDSKLALVETGSNKNGFTFGQVKQFSYSIADTLEKKYGFQKGDVVLVLMENRIEFPILLFGVSALGGIISGANPLYTHEELAKQIADSGTKYIVTTSARLSVVQNAINGIKDQSQIRTIFSVDLVGNSTNINGIVPFGDLLLSKAKTYPAVNINSKVDPLLLPYSSGTTGLPKGVVLTHYNLQCLLYARRSKGLFTTIEAGESVILLLPFFHIAGFLGLIVCIHNLGLGVFIRQFDPTGYLTTVQQYKASLIYAVPSILVFLAKDPSVEKYDLSTVRVLAFGAAPAGKELLEAVAKRLPNLESLVQGYGLTESSGLATVTPAMPASKYPLGSCGVPHPYVEIKVTSIDDKNQELGPMNRGEILVRGPNVMLRYHNNQKATEETVDKDGWLHTGDIGYFDYSGYFYIVDRVKELIKYKGFQVAPAELEDVLLKHPAIQEVAVTGIPDTTDPDVGELPTAFVVLKSTHSPSEEIAISIKRVVSDHLAPFKHLRGGIVFLSQIPQGPTGKVLRRLLKEIKEKVYVADKAHHKAKM